MPSRAARKPCEGIWVALNCRAVEPAETQRGRVAQGRAVKALWMCWTVGFLDTTACLCGTRTGPWLSQTSPARPPNQDSGFVQEKATSASIAANENAASCLLHFLHGSRQQVGAFSDLNPGTLGPDRKLPAGSPARISHMRPGAGLRPP